MEKTKVSKNTILLSAIALTLVVAMTPGLVIANASNSKWAAELMWGNNVEWMMIAPPGPGSANPAEPLYIVAPQTGTPQSPADNDHLPGVAHDHVIAPPARNGGAFNANWEVYLVGCVPTSGSCTFVIVNLSSVGGPSSFPLALSYNGNPLTNDGAIQAGAASGALFTVDTGINFICAVAPLK